MAEDFLRPPRFPDKFSKIPCARVRRYSNLEQASGNYAAVFVRPVYAHSRGTVSGLK